MILFDKKMKFKFDSLQKTPLQIVPERSLAVNHFWPPLRAFIHIVGRSVWVCD